MAKIPNIINTMIRNPTVAGGDDDDDDDDGGMGREVVCVWIIVGYILWSIVCSFDIVGVEHEIPMRQRWFLAVWLVGSKVPTIVPLVVGWWRPHIIMIINHHTVHTW
jgi:hypothetical protein